MQIILLSRSGHTRVQLCPGSLLSYLSIISIIIVAVVAFAIFGKEVSNYAQADDLMDQLYAQTEAQQKTVADTIRTTEENLDALAMRLGRMHAHVIRLEAFGKRLAQMSGLDEGEFSFDQSPALGGPFRQSDLEARSIPDFLLSLESLADRLDSLQPRLQVLEGVLMEGRIDAEAHPSGRPIENGWISSPYGSRADPFTGQAAFHEGIDFAGKIGTPIIAVASGVVVFSGTRKGYGNMLEINHGKGYATRYGHNSKLMVEAGDTVRKGDQIGTLGSTGRSTGPHVHFEVLRNGHHINPTRFVKSKS